MERDDFAKLSDEEIIDLSKKAKAKTWLNALLIGIMIGVLVYGVAKGNIGIFTLAILYVLYKIFTKPKENSLLKEELTKRNLK